MIDKQELTQFVEEALQGTGCFLVDVNVMPGNVINVEIDNADGVDIETCVELTRKIESRFDRDVEDYELEVGSAGLTSPFKVVGQYQKNIGNEIEVLTKDGRKLTGVLTEVEPDGSAFVMEISRKVKLEGKKRPEIVVEPLKLAVADTKTVKYLIKFK